MTSIQVILADDHTIVRKGLRALLDEAEHIQVVAEAQNGRDVLQLVSELRPDVVIMDITMPELNGLEAARRVIAMSPETKIIILTMHSDEEYILQSLRAGAHAYLVKQSAPKELVQAINISLAGEYYVSSHLSTDDIDELIERATREAEFDDYLTLTDRERDVLQLIAEGHDIGRIAAKLSISSKTVRAHRRHLMDKLGRHSPAALTRYALRRGIISLDK